jgi:3-deoxy-D-manno-octulosonate 8-phosphate phosphatase (KDO 8-P phosphatase)
VAEPSITAGERRESDLHIARSIRLILSDVDGVLTDGQLIYTSQGVDIKQFHVRDGMGIKVWQRAGHSFGIISSRSSDAVRTRAAELGIHHLAQGADPKLPAVLQLLQSIGIDANETAYVGDDLPDVPVMRAVALAVAPADASADALAAAHWVTRSGGGRGVVRELVERLMRATSTWEEHALS